jgi:hypothetical protein
MYSSSGRYKARTRSKAADSINVNTRLCYAFGVFLSTPIRCDMSGTVLRRVEPNAAGGGVIESVQLSACALEDSRSEHRLGKPQTAYHVLQGFSAFTLGHAAFQLRELLGQSSIG